MFGYRRDLVLSAVFPRSAGISGFGSRDGLHRSPEIGLPALLTSPFVLPASRRLFASLLAPFYRRLEIVKPLIGHGLPYFLITEP